VWAGIVRRVVNICLQSRGVVGVNALLCSASAALLKQTSGYQRDLAVGLVPGGYEMRDINMGCGTATRRSAFKGCMTAWDETGIHGRAVRNSRGKSGLLGQNSGRWRIALSSILKGGREIEATIHERPSRRRDVEAQFRRDLNHFLKRDAGPSALHRVA